MPHTADCLVLQDRRLAGDREQYVASREFETARARRNYRLHHRDPIVGEATYTLKIGLPRPFLLATSRNAG